MLKLLNIRVLNLCRPTTWCVQKGLHTTGLKHKRRKTEEEKKNPNAVVFVSKFKKGEPIDVWKNMTMTELATALGKDINHVLDVMTFIDNTNHYKKPDQVITDFKVIEAVVHKSGKRCKIVGKPVPEKKVEIFQDLTRRDPSTYTDVRPRPPVVTIMGHVDHGKTTLLDTLRSSSIVASEFGGITQHIGAFSVLLGKDTVTFLDTPGHAAFCAMRSRGAQCTDIVVLVVAADDGVMEQTVESIRMAKEANVPIIAALNKIDKPTADIERAKKMLVQHQIQVEDYGGDVQVVPISALKGTNVDTLMEAILVQAELMELKSDYSGPVEGVIIESSTDIHRGKLSTVLIQCGTLKKGNILVAGTAWGKVRAIFNDQGQPVQNATPSTPVECLGWKSLPSPGDVVIEVASEKMAHKVVEFREQQLEKEKQLQDLEAITEKEKEHNKKYKEMLEQKRKLGRFRLKPQGPRQKLYQPDDTIKLNVIIKGDVDGSVEAILDVLDTYDSDQCKLNVIHYGVGPVTQNDVVLAQTFNGIIYAFNTKPLPDINYNVKQINVIYKLVDDIKAEINKLLPEKDVEEVIGEANVLQEFLINEGKHKVPVAGSRCTKGILKKACMYKLIRNGEVLYDGKLTSLRHLKDEVDTIKKDVDCGIRLMDTSINFKPGDTLVCYKINKVKQEIDWDPGF